MSDFDKEAEREKLRKKYEREEEKRKATEQMSELLLKGATMTNAHCGDCGDPIFRYDGQEFCPTCQKPVDRGTDDAGESGDGHDESADADGGADETAGTDEAEPADANGQSPGEIEVTSPSDDATVRFGGEGVDDEGDDGEESSSATEREATPSASASAPESESRRAIDPTGADPTGSSTLDAEIPTDGTASEHLGQAQVVLAQTVERFARRAAAADDPRDAREYLETAREAARTLDAARF